MIVNAFFFTVSSIMILRWILVLLLSLPFLFGVKPNSSPLKGDNSNSDIEEEESEKKVASFVIKDSVI